MAQNMGAAENEIRNVLNYLRNPDKKIPGFFIEKNVSQRHDIEEKALVASEGKEES